jgi:hypothetical protein
MNMSEKNVYGAESQRNNWKLNTEILHFLRQRSGWAVEGDATDDRRKLLVSPNTMSTQAGLEWVSASSQQRTQDSAAVDEPFNGFSTSSGSSGSYQSPRSSTKDTKLARIRSNIACTITGHRAQKKGVVMYQV